jgi:DNA-binding NtrC family response regulator/predicted hydrocarbon binding protein
VVRKSKPRENKAQESEAIQLFFPDDLSQRRFPDIADLASRLRFSPSEGQVWLSDRRMVLLHSASLASLRRELIETLGFEQARGVLTRAGYISGMQDAELSRRQRQGQSYFDIFSVGPQLHSLEGFVAVETVDVEFDVEKGLFRGEFIWRNSCEAEEHIAAYGIGNEAVCWMQQGYANGYVSTFMGRQIVVREVECKGMGHACCRIVCKPLEEWDDSAADVRFFQAQNFVQTPLGQPGALAEVAGATNLVGVSAGFNAVCHMLKRVAPTRATVLFLGESGVGKEQFAKTLHRISKRAEQPFVAVNCAAIPEPLIESELFGVEKGGFSGATESRPGRFERANGGTLFLDEIGTLSLFAQGKLLRALQEGEIERIGDTRTRRVDVRVIAATNVDLRSLVAKGTFREDLFFRLNVFPVSIPPLRERREDILLLTEHFLNRYATMHERPITGLTERAIEALLAYDWPGNIRELENIIERGVILAPDEGVIDLCNLFTSGERVLGKQFKIGKQGALLTSREHAAAPPRLDDPEQVAQLVKQALEDQLISLDTMDELLVHAANDLAGGNVSAAAKLLGTTRARVAYRLQGKKVKREPG